VGCGEPEVILTVDDMTLFALDGPCAPADPIARIDVTALGDFPASDARVATLELGQSEERITRFPLDTELLTVRAVNPSWEGVATPAYVRGDITREVLLLPLGRSCELPAAEINLPVDGAATALTGGAFLIAGGAVSEPSVDCPSGFAEGTRRAVLVGPDGRVAAVIALLTPRLGATATFAKGRAVIVGGSPYQCDAALDTFEMLDATQPNPVFETFRLCPDELDECVGRRDHGAGVLADGRILVYGGIQRAGVPDAVLDTGLIIDPANPGVVETDLNYEIDPGTFMPRRRFAQILTLDNGLTILTGGRGVLDATQEWQGEAYAFDPTTNRFMRVDTGSKDDKFYPTTDGTGAGRLDPVPAVVLPRARIAFVDPTTHLVWLARFDPRAEAPMPLRTFAVVDELDLDWPGRTTDKLESARAVALSDGTILVTGIDEGISKAWVVDVGFGTVVAVDRSALPSAPAALLALADGVVAELGPNGSAVRRQILRTRFDNPPATLLPTDREWVAPDSTRGIAFDIEGVHSDRDARVVVPSLELAWFSLVLQAEAGVDIELFSEGPVNTTVHLRPEPGHGFEFGLVGCTVPWDGSSPVRLERRGTSLTIEAGERRTCTRQLSDRVQLAFRLAPTAALERVQIERLTTP
jgi:hypothetical protein